MQPRIGLAFWATSPQCWPMLSFSSTVTLKSFSTWLLSITCLPNLWVCLALPQFRCKGLALCFVELHEVQQTHLWNPSRSPWMASLLSSVLTVPHCFIVVSKYDEGALALSMSPTKTLDSICHSADLSLVSMWTMDTILCVWPFLASFSPKWLIHQIHVSSLWRQRCSVVQCQTLPAQVQVDDVSCSALPLAINPVGLSQKVSKFIKHDFPLVKPCWLLPSTMYKNVLHYAQSKSILVQIKTIAPCLLTKDLHKKLLSIFLPQNILYIERPLQGVSGTFSSGWTTPPLLVFFIGEVLQGFEYFHSQKGANRILQKVLLLRFQLCLCLFLIFALIQIISPVIS